jgi:hypothetical protein
VPGSAEDKVMEARIAEAKDAHARAAEAREAAARAAEAKAAEPKDAEAARPADEQAPEPQAEEENPQEEGDARKAPEAKDPERGPRRTTRPGKTRTAPPPRSTGELRIITQLNGKNVSARVTVDGVDKGHTPIAVQLPLGKHDVTVQRPSSSPVARQVKVTGEKAQVLKIEVQN